MTLKPAIASLCPERASSSRSHTPPKYPDRWNTQSNAPVGNAGGVGRREDPVEEVDGRVAEQEARHRACRRSGARQVVGRQPVEQGRIARHHRAREERVIGQLDVDGHRQRITRASRNAAIRSAS